MSISAIGSNYQNQRYVPATAVGTEQKQPGGISEINKLNAEIKKAESEMKETAKEVQKAVGQSVGGSSEKVQMLQNKIQMQQQAILTKQLKIKDIEDPTKATTKQVSAEPVATPRFDRYAARNDASGQPDNVYRLEEKDGAQNIVFNRPKEPANPPPQFSQQSR